MALTEKQAKFVEEYLKTKDATLSAIVAGYAEGSAQSMGCQLLNHPEISSLINPSSTSDQPENFNLAKAMKEADEAYKLAKKNDDPSAMKNASEYKSKLHGMLKDSNKDERNFTINIDVGRVCSKCGHSE